MKKYLFGLSAIVLAIGFSAFTKPVKSTSTDYRFVYTGPIDDFESGDVTNTSNWVVDEAEESFCQDDVLQQVTCSFTTDESLIYLKNNTYFVGQELHPDADIIVSTPSLPNVHVKVLQVDMPSESSIEKSIKDVELP